MVNKKRGGGGQIVVLCCSQSAAPGTLELFGGGCAAARPPNGGPGGAGPPAFGGNSWAGQCGILMLPWPVVEFYMVPPYYGQAEHRIQAFTVQHIMHICNAV